MNQPLGLSTKSFTDTIHLPHRHLQSGIMPEVYSWLFPPVRDQITNFMQQYPMDTFLQNIQPGLDNAHLGLFEAYAKYNPEILGLNDYQNIYPLAGSSEGIFNLLVYCNTKYPTMKLYALADEYKGYEALANSIGRKMHLLKAADLLHVEPGILFISNPSAIDGNFLEPNIFNALISRHKSIVDLAYVGLAPRHEIDLTDPNILAVVASLSKPFGLYYYRIGMMWSRENIDSLYGTKWFKNLHGIMLGEKILTHFEGSLYDWVKPRQQRAIDYINDAWGTSFRPADVALLAICDTIPAHMAKDLARFKRGNIYRICLTPLMMHEANDMQLEVL